ncbi:hypothetical protein [Haliangium sp.]|uniref:hypothetical protein n=1 Tax=Haliangium sp. TaxID=2663208 RepID=UPI003D14A961
MSNKTWWYISSAICVACVLLIYLMWYSAIDRYRPSEEQIVSTDVAERYLSGLHYDGAHSQPRVYVPTGVFVQSLKFVNASDVNITGYLWQRYDRNENGDLLQRFDDFKTVPGFVLPEQVDSVNTVIDEGYRREDGSELTIGWYFDVTLRQPFDYSLYPLDQHNVWIRLWHQEFDGNVVLVPDLSSYKDTAAGVAFGLDHELVPGGWKIEETFFFYRSENYDTDFGIDSYIGQTGFPELHFNVVVSRKFMNAFVINLVPLIVVITLLFSVMMIVTSDEKKMGTFGFSTSGALGTASALFFVVMLAHIQLREQFAGAGIVYLEWFYLVTYVAILLVSLDIYVFTAGKPEGRLRFVFYRDNLLAKLLYWPTILVTLTLVTLWFF